jgi:phage terminase large subunit GpA-like protein
LTSVVRSASGGLAPRLGPVYFEPSERRVIRYKRGRPSRRFERARRVRRAEALDALVYAHAARQAVVINFDQWASELAAAPVPARRRG